MGGLLLLTCWTPQWRLILRNAFPVQRKASAVPHFHCRMSVLQVRHEAWVVTGWQSVFCACIMQIMRQTIYSIQNEPLPYQHQKFVHIVMPLFNIQAIGIQVVLNYWVITVWEQKLACDLSHILSYTATADLLVLTYDNMKGWLDTLMPCEEAGHLQGPELMSGTVNNKECWCCL